MYNNILDYFVRTVAAYPNKAAVVNADQQMTFAQLDWRARKLGAVLAEQCGNAIRRPVGVLLPKSFMCTVSDVAILYSGNAYMNLDVKTPAQRLQNIVDTVQPICIVTGKRYAQLCAEATAKAGTPVVYYEDIITGEETVGEPARCENYKQIIGTDLLCLINTSGSTGTPKSVALNHYSNIDYVHWAVDTFRFTENEIIGSISPVVFDIYNYEFCLMMIHGCTLDLIPENYPIFPARLMQYLAEHRITHFHWVPTILVNIANMDLLSRIALPDLRVAWSGGEVLPTRQLNYWRAHQPNTTFVNVYGPTEITVDCTYYIVDRDLQDDEPVPIGIPRPNNDILILNDNNELVKRGEEGEICVRGSCLAMGYYNNPEKTAAVFVQNPLNKAYPELIYRTGDIGYWNERGEIVYSGRNDSLIKHQGKRIELGEIEHVIINTLKLVRNGCAVYAKEKKQIVFYYEADKEWSAVDLRKAIGKALPSYMIPGQFNYCSELPRNTNGKIDRLKLKNLANA